MTVAPIPLKLQGAVTEHSTMRHIPPYGVSLQATWRYEVATPHQGTVTPMGGSWAPLSAVSWATACQGSSDTAAAHRECGSGWQSPALSQTAARCDVLLCTVLFHSHTWKKRQLP